MGLAYLGLPASEREWWVARHEKKAAEHSCGNPRDVCSDPKKKWYPQLTKCFPTMEREAAAAKYARLHSERPWHDGAFDNWSDKPSDFTPYRYDMGVTIWVAQRDYSPNDTFLSSESPVLVGQDEEDQPGGNGERQDG